MNKKICPICGFNNNLTPKSTHCTCCGMSLEDDGTELWKQLKAKANIANKKLEENLNQSPPTTSHLS